MKQSAIFCCEKKNQAVDEAKQLPKELRERQFSSPNAIAERAVFCMGKKARTKRKQRRFHPVPEPVPGNKAFRRCGLTPVFEDAF